MQAVTCPQCKRVYQIDRPGPQTTVRCRRCGTEFLAAPNPPQPPAGAKEDQAARPVRLHMYHRTRRKAGPWTAVVTLVFLGGAIALGMVLWAQLGKQRPEPAATSQPTARQPRSQPVRTTDRWTGEALTGKTVRNDKSVHIELRRIQGDIPGHWIVVAALHNNHEYAVLEAKVSISAGGKGKKPSSTRSIACRYIPAGDSVGVSTEFVGLSTEDLQFSAVVDTVGVAPKTICVPVDPQSCRMERDTANRRIVITGELRNIADFALSDVRVFCDFYTRQGEWRAEAVGELTSAKRIEPNGTAGFRAVMDGKQAGILVEIITDRPALRMVAVKR